MNIYRNNFETNLRYMYSSSDLKSSSNKYSKQFKQFSINKDADYMSRLNYTTKAKHLISYFKQQKDYKNKTNSLFYKHLKKDSSNSINKNKKHLSSENLFTKKYLRKINPDTPFNIFMSKNLLHLELKKVKEMLNEKDNDKCYMPKRIHIKPTPFQIFEKREEFNKFFLNAIQQKKKSRPMFYLNNSKSKNESKTQKNLFVQKDFRKSLYMSRSAYFNYLPKLSQQLGISIKNDSFSNFIQNSLSVR